MIRSFVDSGHSSGSIGSLGSSSLGLHGFRWTSSSPPWCCLSWGPSWPGISRKTSFVQEFSGSHQISLPQDTLLEFVFLLVPRCLITSLKVITMSWNTWGDIFLHVLRVLALFNFLFTWKNQGDHRIPLVWGIGEEQSQQGIHKKGHSLSIGKCLGRVFKGTRGEVRWSTHFALKFRHWYHLLIPSQDSRSSIFSWSMLSLPPRLTPIHPSWLSPS